jgi:hypothetical protein
MSGSQYLFWTHGQFEKMTFFPLDPLLVIQREDQCWYKKQETKKKRIQKLPFFPTPVLTLLPPSPLQERIHGLEAFP